MLIFYFYNYNYVLKYFLWVNLVRKEGWYVKRI